MPLLKQQIIRQAVINLSDSNIKSLPSNTIQAIPAPGIGLVNILISASYTWKIQTAYSNVNSNSTIWLQYGNTVNQASTLNFLSTATAPQNGIDVAINQFWIQNPFLEKITASASLITEDTALADMENQPIVISVINAGGNFTGGNALNSLKLSIYYIITQI